MTPDAAAAERLHAWIDEHAEHLIETACDLVRFDTTAVSPGSDPEATNAEGECQAYVRKRLARCGYEVSTLAPDPADFARHPMMPRGHHWRGREMTLARRPGHRAAAGRSLIINGHIDVVSAEPRAEWSVDPFGGCVVDGRLVSRGSVDMKGGFASALLVAEALEDCNINLAGDLWIQAVTDEETCGMGSVVMATQAPAADAAVVPEPTAYAAWTVCRGVMYASLTCTGRAGHAELPQPPVAEGGAVNAIQQAMQAVDVLADLDNSWQERFDGRPLLSAPRIVPTLISGGEFVASYPASCTVTLDVTYLPEQADAEGFGSRVRSELESATADRPSSDPWLASHPHRWEWLADYPPFAPDGLDPLLDVVRTAVESVGKTHREEGLDSWHDAASLGLFGGTPAISFGPGPRGQAHRVDEAMPIDELVRGAHAYANLILEWCGYVS